LTATINNLFTLQIIKHNGMSSIKKTNIVILTVQLNCVYWKVQGVSLDIIKIKFPLFGRLVAGLTPRSSGFDPMTFLVRVWCTKQHCDGFLSK